MTTLADFLLARIAEDEVVARAAIANGEGALDWADAGDPTDAHIARWDPARVLAECKAKRVVVAGWFGITDTGGVALEQYGQGVADGYAGALEALALPYAGHPDYDQARRP